MTRQLSRHFTFEEMACPCGCGVEPDVGFLSKLEVARGLYGKPMTITSGMRCAAYQASINPKVPVTGHTRYGVDIACGSGTQRWYMVRALIDAGFSRVGLYDKHLHIDDHPKLPKNVIWIGKSK